MRPHTALLVPVAALILHLGVSTARAQDRPGTRQGVGDRASLIVDDSALSHSAHARLVCVACHTGLDPKNVPYRGTIEPVKCLRCHADAQFKHPFHPELAMAIRADRQPRVSCKDCHGTHDVVSPKVPGSPFHVSRIGESCGACHRNAADRFPGSIHGKALVAGVKGAPTCLSCHRRRISFASGATDSLSGKAAQAQLCLTCHLDTPEVRARTSPTAGFITGWESGAHGTALAHGDARAANCVSCHGSHEIGRNTDPASRVGRIGVAATCAKCHAQNEKKFTQSAHGIAVHRGDTAAPACTTCHGEHAKPAAAGARAGVAAGTDPAQVCSRCHDPVPLTGTYGIASDRFRTFGDSYHGFAMRGSSVEAANCASCHDAHDVKPPGDSTSSINTVNRPVTCGKCHKRATERFSIGPVHAATTAHGKPIPYRAIAAAILALAVLAGGTFMYTRQRRRASF